MIEIQNVSKKYGDKHIFKKLNLKIKKNKITIIYGVSGRGKTTLLNMIGGLEQFESGEIKVNGKLIKGNIIEKRKTFNYIFQNFGLIDDESIFDNLMYSLKFVKVNKKLKKEKIINALSFVSLNKDIKTKIYSLSGGEQQRVAIARALLKPGDVILADEPTGSLDKENTEKIMELLISLKKEKTIVVVSHDHSLKKYADEIIEL